MDPDTLFFTKSPGLSELFSVALIGRHSDSIDANTKNMVGFEIAFRNRPRRSQGAGLAERMRPLPTTCTPRVSSRSNGIKRAARGQQVIHSCRLEWNLVCQPSPRCHCPTPAHHELTGFFHITQNITTRNIAIER